MNTTDLTRALAARTDLSASQCAQVLRALAETVAEQLEAGDDVRVHNLGTFSRSWRGRTTIRSLANGRKLMIGGRHVARFRPAKRLRDVLAAEGDQTWRDADHQAAWRLARTLVSDLDAYANRRPTLSKSTPDDEVVRACGEAFGDTWRQAWTTYQTKAPADASAEYLLDAARSQWSAT